MFIFFLPIIKVPINFLFQILNWLSHSPSEIESYIRPGCVVLSVYASMPLIAWEEVCIFLFVEEKLYIAVV